jgi:hypothetical protein
MAKRRKKTIQKASVPRQYALVRFAFENVPAEHHSKYPFTQEAVYVYFGEIPNMYGGHCVVAEFRTGQIFSGYHTENFIEVSEDEF